MPRVKILNLAVMLVFAAACTFPVGTQEQESATEDVSALLTQAAAAAAAGLTQTAQLGPQATDTETIAGPAETATSTATEAPPTLTVSVDTNCRSGPGFKYFYRGALLIGEVGQIVGKAEDGEYVVIVNPDRPGEECWVWLEYGQVFGSLDGVPIFDVPSIPKASGVGGYVWIDFCNPGAAGNPPPGCVSIGGEYKPDGVKSGSDSGFASVVVRLGLGACPATGYAQTTTDANGNYSFANLEAGTYCVSIDPSQPLPAFGGGDWSYPIRTTGVIYVKIELDAGEVVSSFHFGWHPGVAICYGCGLKP